MKYKDKDKANNIFWSPERKLDRGRHWDSRAEPQYYEVGAESMEWSGEGNRKLVPSNYNPCFIKVITRSGPTGSFDDPFVLVG